jgi:hypothetical protein
VQVVQNGDFYSFLFVDFAFWWEIKAKEEEEEGEEEMATSAAPTVHFRSW